MNTGNVLRVAGIALATLAGCAQDALYEVPGTKVANVCCTPSTELCNGADDDCDPTTPDGADEPEVGEACDGSDGDLCAEGEVICTAQGLLCTDFSTNDAEVCDGIDNDCNPETADGVADPLIGSPCDGEDADLCLEGALHCTPEGLSCSDTTSAAQDTCDGLDNDCD